MKRYQYVIEFDEEDDAAAKDLSEGLDCFNSEALDHSDPPLKKVTRHLQVKETGEKLKQY